jgi:hypothetical protein
MNKIIYYYISVVGGYFNLMSWIQWFLLKFTSSNIFNFDKKDERLRFKFSYAYQIGGKFGTYITYEDLDNGCILLRYYILGIKMPLYVRHDIGVPNGSGYDGYGYALCIPYSTSIQRIN